MEIQSISVVGFPTQTAPNPKQFTWEWRKGDDLRLLAEAIPVLQASLRQLQTAAAVACSSSRPLETGE